MLFLCTVLFSHSFAALFLLSSTECINGKHLSVDGRQINLELYDPCSQVSLQIAVIMIIIIPQLMRQI